VNERTKWATVAMLLALAAAFSAIVGTVHNGYDRLAYYAAAVLFGVACILVFKTRNAYLTIFDRVSVVNCLRLKRPGIDRKVDEESEIKGKMPKDPM
jgi:hypothetical protein